MPVPSSREKALRLAIAAYLTAECTAISESVAWDDFEEAIALNENKGAVWLPTVRPVNQSNLNLFPVDRTVEVRLVLGRSTQAIALSAAEDWMAFLFSAPNSVFRKLHREGTQGYFKGIELERCGFTVKGGQDMAIALLTATYTFMDDAPAVWI